MYEAPWLSRKRLSIGPHALPGELAVPRGAVGVVLFAHGSGSSRLSPRNAWVAAQLHRRGLGTVLFDLLTNDEAHDRRRVFDIPLLTSRVIEAIDTLASEPLMKTLPLGLFGASTGAAAALGAAVARAAQVHAVVSRGGRPDLAVRALPRVQAPTLLIVGGEDTDVLELNRAALARMHCTAALEVVPGASHLFEEPGKLQAAATLACDWFVHHLAHVHAAAQWA